jgi:hypothetical protein
MVPVFNKDGALPPGEHEVSLAEFEDAFVYNDRRREIFTGFLKLINDLRSINCRLVYVDGSYVTDKEEPGDIDVCWHEDEFIDWDRVGRELQILLDLDYPRDWQQLVYNADVFPANVLENDSKKLFKDFFQQHKETGNPKGIIKIKIGYDQEQ